MRFLYPIFILLSLSTVTMSCNQKEIDYSLIIGSWKLRDVVNQTGQNISGKTIFKKDSTVVTEMLLDGEVVEKITMKYSLNRNKRTIIAQHQDYVFESKIEKLTKNELIVKDTKTGKVTRSIRY